MWNNSLRNPKGEMCSRRCMLINGYKVDVSELKEVVIDGEMFWRNKTVIFNSDKKSCSKCKEIKEFSEFSKKDGFLSKQFQCKECNREYHENNKEKVKERMKEYYENNKEKIKERSKEYQENNKEKIKERMKEYNKEYRENNKERMKEYRKEYKNSPALYDIYAHQLTIDESPIKEGELLSVKCTYCGKYFNPTNRSVQNRIRAINNLSQGEHRLYCSDGCKDECPTYGSHGVNHTNTKLAREANPVLRQAVLKRDGYMCQKCHSTEKLHCHHIVPYKTDPGMAEDTDNCITFCRKCHYEIHGLIDGCGLGDLRMAENKCDNNS